MRSFVIIAILLVNSMLAYTQQPDVYLDSLISASEEYADTTCYAYSKIGQLLAYQRPMESFKYLHKAADRAKAIKDYKAMALNYSFIGIAYSQMGMFEKAFENFNIQRSIARQHNVADEYVWANNNIANSFLILRNPQMAHDYAMEALEGVQKLQDIKAMHNIYATTAWVYLQERNYDSSIYWYSKALELRILHDNERIDMAASLRDIGNVYFAKGDYVQARSYYLQCGQYIDTLTTDIMADIYSHLAIMHLNNGNQDSAYYCAHKSISIARRFHSGYILSNSFGVLGDIFKANGDYKNAEKAYATKIAYTDSIASPSAAQAIFDNQLSNIIDRQNTNIVEAESNYHTNIAISLMVVALLTVAIILGYRKRKAKKTIASLNQQMNDHDTQLYESMTYAKKIQKAVAPNFEEVAPACADKFMLFKPKNAVSGNIFWHYNYADYYMYAVGECGSTGIAGACMSMIATSMLFEVTVYDDDPAIIVNMLRKRLMKIVRNFNPEAETAMNSDVSFLVRKKSTDEFRFCGILSPLVVFHNGMMTVYNGTPSEKDNLFSKELESVEPDIQKGDQVYIMTSGYYRQTGGPDGAELSKQRLYDTLSEIHEKPMSEQKEILERALSEWKGDRQQDHDITLSGFTY